MNYTNNYNLRKPEVGVDDFKVLDQNSNADSIDLVLHELHTQMLAVDAGPKGTYATYAALQAAFPTGHENIYLVSADGHWYYWSNPSWMDGGQYQAMGFSDPGGYYESDTVDGAMQEVGSQLSEIVNEKATKSELTSETNARLTEVAVERARIDLLKTSAGDYFIKCLSTDSSALLVVASGATTGQINLASVSPKLDTYTPIMGDYVRLVSNALTSETTDIRVGLDGIMYSTAGNAVRGQIGKKSNEIKQISEGTKQLFDWVNADVRNAYCASAVGLVASDTSRSVVIPITVTNQTHITVRREMLASRFVIWTCRESNPVIGTPTINGDGDYGATQYQYTIPIDSTIKSIIVFYWRSTDTSIDPDVFLKSLMVQFGQSFTGYEEYRVPKGVAIAQTTADNAQATADSSARTAVYGAISVDHVLLNTGLQVWTGCTLSNNVANITEQNGGVITNAFTSASNSVRIKLTGTFTVGTCAINLKYTNSLGAVTYVTLTTLIDGTLDESVSFDAAYYAVYHDAVSFAIIVNAINIDYVGTITIDDLKIYNESPFEQSEYYDDNLIPMMQKVFNGIDSASSGAVSNGGNILYDGTGAKFSMQVTTSGTLVAVPHIPTKTLFMGNSLLLGLDTNGVHGGAFGLAATDSTKDFAYHVEQAILSKNANATFSKLHDAVFEMAESESVADAYITTNTSIWTSDLDLVIIQIGDNVNTDIRRSVFATKFPKLIQAIRTASPNARILVAGIWFTSATFNTVYECTKYGCELVDIRSLYINDNLGVTGATITYNDSTTGTIQSNWATHPGNTGMLAIANAIIEKLDM